MRRIFLFIFISSCTCRPESVIISKRKLDLQPSTLVVNGDSDSRTAGTLETIYFENEHLRLAPQDTKNLKRNVNFLLKHPEMIVGLTGISSDKDLKEEKAYQYALYIKELMIQSDIPRKQIRVFVKYETVENEMTQNSQQTGKVVFNIIHLGSKKNP